MDPVIRTYYIVFDKKRNRVAHWWRLFTTREFAHCYVMTDATEGTTVKMELLVGGLDFRILKMPVDQAVQAFSDSDVTAILSYTVNSTNLNNWVPKGYFSCVSFIKSLLWMRKTRLTLTPFHLYRKLIKHGAIIIKPYSPYLEVK